MDERTDKARAAYEAWGRGDLDGVLVILDPDVEFVSSGEFPGIRPVYRGHDGMREFWQEFMEGWESLEIHPVRFEGKGDLLVALWKFAGRGRGGVPVQRDGAHVAHYRGDIVVRLESHVTWESALAALDQS